MIRNIKAQIASIRDEIMAEAEKEINAKTQALVYALEDACYNIFIESGKVAEVQRQYGTKDYRTVKDLIDRGRNRAETLHALAVQAQDETPRYVAEPIEDAEDVYRLIDTETGQYAALKWTAKMFRPSPVGSSYDPLWSDKDARAQYLYEAVLVPEQPASTALSEARDRYLNVT